MAYFWSVQEFTTWSPLFSSIIDSSIWLESKETRLVWITMLAKKDRNGYVRGSPGTLARDAGVTPAEALEALRVLLAPDPLSNTKTKDGRRIEEVDGGWLIINHFLHRERISKTYRLAYQAAWQKEYRKRKKAAKEGAKHNGGCDGAKEAIREGLSSPMDQSPSPWDMRADALAAEADEGDEPAE